MAGNIKVGGNTIFTHTGAVGAGTVAADNIDTVNVGNNALVVDASGNVGIGTTSPTEPLDVMAISANSRVMIGDSGISNVPVIKARNSLDTGYRNFGYDAFNHRFYIEGTESMRIGSTGDVEIKTTNANLILPSGGGIDFGTSTSGSGTVTGGVLDDYEEGTWSPTISSTGGGVPDYATYGSSISGQYLKVGSLVTLHFSIRYTTSAPGNIAVDDRITLIGLPFSINTQNDDLIHGSGAGFSYKTGSSNALWTTAFWYDGTSRLIIYCHHIDGTVDYYQRSIRGTIVYRSTT